MNDERFIIHKNSKDKKELISALNELKKDFEKSIFKCKGWAVSVYTPEALQNNPMDDDGDYVRFIFSYLNKAGTDIFYKVEHNDFSEIRDLFFKSLVILDEAVEADKSKLTDEETVKLYSIMSELGYTTNRHIYYVDFDLPDDVRELLNKARESKKEYKIKMNRDNLCVYLREIKRIGKEYEDCVDDCDNPLDNDIAIIAEDVEAIEEYLKDMRDAGRGIDGSVFSEFVDKEGN